jgi:hypothetical protein
MSSDDFIYVPAAQKSNLDDILNRVQAEKADKDANAKPDPQDIVEETLKKLDINSKVSEQIKAIQAERDK